MRWLLLVLRAWSPDGSELTFTTSAGLSQAADEPAKFALNVLSLKDRSVQLWKDFGPRSASRRPANFSFSPDGRYSAYDLPDESGGSGRVIHVLPRSSSASSLLVGGPGNSTVLGWTPDGKAVLFANDRRGSVDAYRVAIADGTAREEPALVKTNIGSARPLGFRADGSLYYINDGFTRAVTTAKFDPLTGVVAGAPRVITQRFVDDIFIPRWSPDGSTLVYATNRNTSGRSAPVLTFRSVATGEERDINLAPVVGSIRLGGAWSPDGDRFYTDGHTPDGKAITFGVRPRTGEVKAVAPGICHLPLPDGDALLCFSREGQSAIVSLDKFDLRTGATSHLKRGPWRVTARALSPDGRSLFYSTPDSRSLRLFPLDNGEERELARTTGEERLTPLDWVGTHAIAYRRLSNGHATYWIRNLQTGSEVELRGVDFPGLVISNNSFAKISFHPSGREVAWVSDQGKNELWVLENVISDAQVAAKKQQSR
jgi:Tol biopolymer transport system component